MSSGWMTPREIERESMRRIGEELIRSGRKIEEPALSVVRRVIHATADFDFADTLFFTENAVTLGRKALAEGKTLVTDTNMALAGISRPSCAKHGNQAVCFMADPEISARAEAEGTTRAWASMSHASELYPDGIYVIGNAPTALLRLDELIRAHSLRPSLVIGVPVGFVNVSESKEKILHTCLQTGTCAIIAKGRKGGSTVAAAIVNALFYGM